jgi:acyl-lipid omega-6 desaturase (Delta-12 desaturase)
MTMNQEPIKSRNELYKNITAPFRGPDNAKSARQLILTLAIFFALWAAMYWSLGVSYLLTLALSIPTAGFLVRLFMIQHDCGHGSYFTSKSARDIVGFWIGVFTLTPYRYWLQSHAHHHSHNGDLDFRGFGDIDTKTVKEYESGTPWQRFGYRIYRNPIILFGIGPSFHFIVKHRYPWDVPRAWKAAWVGIWLTNLALVALVAGLGYLLGYVNFLLVQTPVTIIACSLGVWLFYVQHQFEETYWHWHKNWNFHDAALQGSSHLVLPRPLQWLTASIGIHHIHHLNSQIPNYRLEECLKANPELQKAPKVTIADSWRLMFLTLWDEDRQELISFREYRRRTRQPLPATAA